MNTEAVTLFLAMCAVVAEAFVAFSSLFYLLGRLGIPAARSLIRDVRVTIGSQTLWLAAIVAVVATSGSLYFSEVAHFTPCNLCWYQRIAMYPLVPMLLCAAIRKDFTIRKYVLVQASIGMAISIYHVLVEHFPSLETSKVCQISNPCTIRWVERFGYLTIPAMALSAFAAIIVLMLYTRERSFDK